ncbi:MAG: hypothetical protein ACKO8H_00210, partial [Microcystis panniformis]
YFKNAPINAGQIGPEIITLLNFKERLHNLGHFHTSYADINDLKHKFGEQLNKIMPKLAREIEPAFQQKQQEIEQALRREIQQLEQKKQEIEQALRREIQQLEQQIDGHRPVTPLDTLIVNIRNTMNLFRRWLIELNKWFKFAILCILALILSLVIFYVREITDPLVAASVCNNTPDFISCGEKLDFPHYPSLGQLLPEEKKGREEFAKGNYKEAISYLEKAWEKEKDPVTLIALNNARVMYQLKSGTISPKNVFTIAVSTGFGDKIPPDFGGSILTGVGWQQYKFNKDNDTFKLIVVMADDSNNKDGAEKVAKELVGRQRIMGIIGPYSSHATYYV